MKKIALALLSLTLALTGCSGRNNVSGEIQLPIYGAEEIQYEIAEAKYMDLSETESFGVTIGYPYAVYLTYPADALVMSFSALKGRTVTEGEVLAELDSSGLDYDISNQQTIMNAAYSASLSGGRAAQLQYEIEKAKLDMLLAEKEKYIIRAPFDGIICETKAISEGAEAKAGDICCAVSEISKTGIYLDNAGSKVRYGQKLQIRIDTTMYDAVVVEAPDSAPDTASGSSAGRAVFDIGEEAMAKVLEESPMAVSAGWATAFMTTEKKNVLAVPDSAVKTTGTESYVTIVDGSERFRLRVTTGEKLGGYTEILNGISEGDIVMAQGSGVFTEPDNEKEQQDAPGFDPEGRPERPDKKQDNAAPV